MKIKKLSEGLNSTENTLIKPITIQLTKLQRDRYILIRSRLKEINPKIQIANFVRKALFDLFDTLEDLINEEEFKKEKELRQQSDADFE